jgi:hypothetical protein
MNLSAKSYFLLSSLLAQGVRIVSSFALFRLLTPVDFGAVALVGLAPGYVAALGDFGALRVVYFLDGHVPKARGTCLSIALIFSGVLALVCLGAGIYLGWVKNEPVFYLLGLLAALNAPLNSAYEFGLMLLNLERNFAFEANTRLLRALVTSGSALGMAWVWLGQVWVRLPSPGRSSRDPFWRLCFSSSGILGCLVSPQAGRRPGKPWPWECV